MTNITVLKNEIQGLTEQKNKLCGDNKVIDAKLREYDSVKKNLEKIIEDTVFKQDQEQREIKNEKHINNDIHIKGESTYHGR